MTRSSDTKGAAQAAPTLDELKERIKTANEKGDRTALAHALEVGALLIQAKAQVPKGQWETWARGNLAMSRNTYALYMRIARNVRSSVHCKSIDEADHLLRGPSRPKQVVPEPKQKPREAGKRLRALHALKREKDSSLLVARIDIMKMVGILEAVDLPELGFGDADEETVADIHAELRILFDWLDRSLAVTTAELSDTKRRETIRKLREDTTGRSPAEIDTARKLADKLERKHLVAV